MYYKRLISALVVMALLVTPATVFAHGDEDHSDDSVTTTNTQTSDDSRSGTVDRRQNAQDKLREKLSEQKTEREGQFGISQERLQARLDEKGVEACEKRQEKITALMNKMNERRTSAYDRITRIFNAVKDYYDKQEELVVENYSQLLSTAQVSKETAKTAMDAQLAIPELDCESEHPRADVTEFRKKRLDSIDAMKAYRDGVKAYGEAIRTAMIEQKNTNEESAS